MHVLQLYAHRSHRQREREAGEPPKALRPDYQLLRKYHADYHWGAGGHTHERLPWRLLPVLWAALPPAASRSPIPTPAGAIRAPSSLHASAVLVLLEVRACSLAPRRPGGHTHAEGGLPDLEGVDGGTSRVSVGADLL